MVNITKEKNSRVEKLREKCVVMPSVCIERGYWLTQSYKETEGEPEVIRRAKGLDKILEHMPINIDEGELIVGSITSKQRGGPVMPDIQWKWYLDQLDYQATEKWGQYLPFSEEEKKKMREFLPYWKGKSLYDKWLARVPADKQKINFKIQTGGSYAGNCMGSYGHATANFEKVLTIGLNGILKEIDEKLAALNLADLQDLEKYDFYTATKIAVNAGIKFSNRYANLARDMAKKETNMTRKAELEKIADICSRVPANPANSFYEAMQSIWMVFAVYEIESYGPGSSIGRPDQYLYPYYKKDKDAGKLTYDQARELIALMYIKCNGMAAYWAKEVIKTYAGFAISCNITIGGIDKHGKDAVNELSYLFLDAEEDVRLTQEDLIIRVHKNNPDAFVIRSCEVATMLRGKFKFISDEIAIESLMSDGKPLDYARDYAVTGCNSPCSQGRTLDIPGGIINLPLILELALNNGVHRLTGEQLGLKTGDARKFKSYEEVWNAYKKQVEYFFPTLLLFKNADKELYAQFAQIPFLSALTDGCLDKGMDLNNGGTNPYVSHAMSLGGAPNVGDSFAAIKKAVFEDKKITMDQLITALEKNFEGEEKILHIIESCPKFGNDDPYVDTLVNDVLMLGQQEAAKTRGFKGAVSSVAGATITGNVPAGEIVGATPDGRKAGMPLADGGLSPAHGRNVNGPTATMKSVASLDLAKLTNGSVLNMRFSPDTLKGEAKMKKFASMIRTYLETGGYLIQFNITGSQMLREAQKNPDKYADLLVRVATYSAYFVELSPELQNDIISRTEFEEL